MFDNTNMGPLSPSLILAQLLLFADDILGEDDQNKQNEGSRHNTEDATGAHDGGKEDQHVQWTCHVFGHFRDGLKFKVLETRKDIRKYLPQTRRLDT